MKPMMLLVLQMRGGWVRKNQCTLQAVANSTRDYLRAIVFLAGNSASEYSCWTFDVVSPLITLLC